MDNEVTHKTCKVCLETRTYKYFWRNHQYKDGYDSRCKICRNAGRRQVRNNNRPPTTPKHLQTFEQMVNLRAVSKEDFVLMWEFLEKIGYDIHSKKSIHEQFVDKWNNTNNDNMTYRKKSRYNVSMYLFDGSLNPEYTKLKKKGK